MGSMIFRRSGTKLHLESTPFGGGRFVTPENEPMQPFYYLTDYLGSTRVVVDDAGNVRQRNDYYAFGKRWDDSDLSDNRFLYNGKEKQVVGALGFADYGARMYDDEMGRWFVTDPLAEKYVETSPYAFCGNNPINRVDLDGNIWVNAQGYYKYQDGKFTKYADSRDRQLAMELQKTPTVKQQFEHLVNGPAITEIRFEKIEGAYGSTRNYLDCSPIKSIIRLDMNNLQDKAKYHGITVMQATASTAGHEIRHTEKENIRMQRERKKVGVDIPYADRPEEIDAHAIGNQIIYEYKNNIKPASDEKSNDRSLWDRFLDLFR